MTNQNEPPLEDQIFSLEEAFPNADEIFMASFKKLDEIFSNALFVLDTNVLLFPYSMRNEGLEQLKELYNKLISSNQLFVPKRVAREFAKNRNSKLAEIYHSLMQTKTGKSKGIKNYPILSGLNEKSDLDKELDKLHAAEQSYQQAVDTLAKTIRAWEWSDPVSTIYAESFDSSILIDHKKSRSDLLSDLERRYKHKIPPGYKDSKKDDGGVGDLAIWLSILELGASQKHDAIFVTEDTKPDWWNQSNGSEFLPRFELIDEYRRISGGKTLHIIRFSKLLELFKIEQEVIEAAKKAEKEKKYHILRALKSVREKRTRKRRAFRRLPTSDQVEEIRAWFSDNFEDPVECCPYESREGGYQFIWGGPYDAREEIEAEYGDIASENMINQISTDLEDQASEWSGHPEDDHEEPENYSNP